MICSLHVRQSVFSLSLIEGAYHNTRNLTHLEAIPFESAVLPQGKSIRRKNGHAVIKEKRDHRSPLFFQPLNKLHSWQLAGLTGFLLLSGLFAPCVELLFRSASRANTVKALLVLPAVLPKQLVLVVLDRPHPHRAGLLAGTSAVERAVAILRAAMTRHHKVPSAVLALPQFHASTHTLLQVVVNEVVHRIGV